MDSNVYIVILGGFKEKNIYIRKNTQSVKVIVEIVLTNTFIRFTTYFVDFLKQTWQLFIILLLLMVIISKAIMMLLVRITSKDMGVGCVTLFTLIQEALLLVNCVFTLIMMLTSHLSATFRPECPKS